MSEHGDILNSEILDLFLQIRPGAKLESLDMDAMYESFMQSMTNKGLSREEILAVLESALNDEEDDK